MYLFCPVFLVLEALFFIQWNPSRLKGSPFTKNLHFSSCNDLTGSRFCETQPAQHPQHLMTWVMNASIISYTTMSMVKLSQYYWDHILRITVKLTPYFGKKQEHLQSKAFMTNTYRCRRFKQLPYGHCCITGRWKSKAQLESHLRFLGIWETISWLLCHLYSVTVFCLAIIRWKWWSFFSHYSCRSWIGNDVQICLDQWNVSVYILE